MQGVKTVKDFTQSVNMGLHFVISGFRLTQTLCKIDLTIWKIVFTFAVVK